MPNREREILIRAPEGWPRANAVADKHPVGVMCDRATHPTSDPLLPTPLRPWPRPLLHRLHPASSTYPRRAVATALPVASRTPIINPLRRARTRTRDTFNPQQEPQYGDLSLPHSGTRIRTQPRQQHLCVVMRSRKWRAASKRPSALCNPTSLSSR